MQLYQFKDAIFVLWLLAGLTTKAISISVPQNDRLQVRGVGVASDSVPNLAYSARSKESQGLTARGKTKYSTRLRPRPPVQAIPAPKAKGTPKTKGTPKAKEPRKQNPDRFLRIGKSPCRPSLLSTGCVEYPRTKRCSGPALQLP